MIEVEVNISKQINVAVEINPPGSIVDDITYRVNVNGELISTTTNPADEDYTINITD